MRTPGPALIVALTISVAALSASQAGSPQSDAPPAPAAAPGSAATVPAGSPVAVPSPGRVFASEAGAVLSTVRADRVADFEKVIGRVHAALAVATAPARRAQAAGWKVFRVTEPGPGASALYLFVMDPAVKDADYTISRILGDAFPAEVQDLFELYNGAVLSQSLLSLTAVARFGEPFTPSPAGKRKTPAVTPGSR